MLQSLQSQYAICQVDHSWQYIEIVSVHWYFEEGDNVSYMFEQICLSALRAITAVKIHRPPMVKSYILAVDILPDTTYFQNINFTRTTHKIFTDFFSGWCELRNSAWKHGAVCSGGLVWGICAHAWTWAYRRHSEKLSIPWKDWPCYFTNPIYKLKLTLAPAPPRVEDWIWQLPLVM